jgi:hypothetical protein
LITLANMLQELAGLFVDDGALALTIVAVVAFAGAAATLMAEVPLAAGAILLIGCLAALFSNAVRAGRR